MKRVLHIVGSLKIGGCERVAVNCMKYAVKEEYQTDFLVFGEEIGELEAEVKQYGCQIIRMSVPPKKIVAFYSEFRKILMTYGPYDIVHSHIYFSSAIPLEIAKKSGVPCCIAHAHSVKRIGEERWEKRIICSVMRKKLNRWVDKFCACSEEAGRWVFGDVGFGEKGSVLPNMIEIERFAYSHKARAAIREELNIPSNESVIGCVGRLVGVKNYHFLLKVFSEYRCKYGGVLIIVGDGDLRKELEQYAMELSVAEAVRFTGARNDVERILSAMDVFVLTSKHEGLGIVLLEAMASGLSCVVNKSAIVSAVTALQPCEAIDNWDIDEWVARINCIMSADRLRNNYNPIEILSEYSVQRFISNVNALYR